MDKDVSRCLCAMNYLAIPITTVCVARWGAILSMPGMIWVDFRVCDRVRTHPSILVTSRAVRARLYVIRVARSNVRFRRCLPWARDLKDTQYMRERGLYEASARCTLSATPVRYISSACIRSLAGRARSGAWCKRTSTIVCRAREGVTTVDRPLHAGQFVPPFWYMDVSDTQNHMNRATFGPNTDTANLPVGTSTMYA